ncbi:transketolase C-terminal domain-containing protein [Desulfovirgula thermocuniculi]|uniref:transketolase C-terminal domain-containing protein n=1 Tax=Desulfovirgula thermocuniculi TaxID=348842 RepID=UPI00041DD1F6|nr:transketolase C-terminal domain-containing protein [Desulfovirgula thermocuniculi]
MRDYRNANEAVALAVRLARVEVVAAYPITPQTAIVEEIAGQIARGELDAEYIRVESEHSALAACYGAAVAGARVFTATSSQGLAYMYEMLHYASGSRVPVVMAVVNRGLAAPWTIWTDHQDSVSCRDTGWIQLYVETAQEALDTALQAYRIAEHGEVLTPVMVCLDGFVLSHTEEVVEIPRQEEVDSFLPPYRPAYYVDPERPAVFAPGMGPDLYPSYKRSQQLAMEKAREVIKAVDEEFGALFGRRYGGLAEPYRCEGAKAVLVTLGSVTSTAREVVDRLRQQGHAVGLLRLRALRPFPAQEIREILGGAEVVAVLDRNCSFGLEGAVCTEVKAALYGLARQPQVLGFIRGLGGQDISQADIEEIFQHALSFSPGRR